MEPRISIRAFAPDDLYAPDDLAAPGDLAELTDLWVLSWQATLASIDFNARRQWFSHYLCGLLNAGSLVLCAADTAVAGFLVLDVSAAYLHQIAVRPDRFGAGVGLLLLDAAKCRCPQRLTLTVNQDNLRAVRFYQREGFAIIGDGVSPNSGLRTWEMAWMAGNAHRPGVGCHVAGASARRINEPS